MNRDWRTHIWDDGSSLDYGSSLRFAKYAKKFEEIVADKPLIDDDLHCTLCGVKSIEINHNIAFITSYNVNIWWTFDVALYRCIFNRKKKQVKVYYRYFMCNDVLTRTNKIHFNFESEYIYNQHIIHRNQHSRFNLEQIVVFNIAYDFCLSPVP